MLWTHWDITATPKSPAESGFPQKSLDASLVIVKRGVSKSYKFKTNPKIKKARNFHSHKVMHCKYFVIILRKMEYSIPFV